MEKASNAQPFTLRAFHKARISQGMKEKRVAGGIIGPLPLGYRRSSYEVDAKPEIDPDLVPTVLEVFHLADHDHSVRGIATELLRRGMTGRKGQPISAAAVFKMLKNPYYRGMDRDPWSGDLILSNHPTLVSEELWIRVQRKLRAKNRHSI